MELLLAANTGQKPEARYRRQIMLQALDAEDWSANWIGILTGVLSGLLYAIYSSKGRSALQRGPNPRK